MRFFKYTFPSGKFETRLVPEKFQHLAASESDLIAHAEAWDEKKGWSRRPGWNNSGNPVLLLPDGTRAEYVDEETVR